MENKEVFTMDMKRAFKVVSAVTAIMLAGQGWAVSGGVVSPLVSSAKSLMSDQIIVKYKNSQSNSATSNQVMSVQQKKAQMTSILNQVSQRTGTPFTIKRELLTGATLVKLDQPKTKAELGALIHELESDSRVAYAEADVMHYPMMVPNDARYNEQWSFFDEKTGIDLPDAWDMATGEGVTVAVIDTGYLPHKDLVNNLIPGLDVISRASISNDGDGVDSDATDTGDWAAANTCYQGQPEVNSSWHGTHVSGIIAASTNNSIGVAGVAYNAKILPIRAIGRCGGLTSDIIDGIVWAVAGAVSKNYPLNPTPAKIINMSFGVTQNSCSYSMQAAIDMAISRGASVVVAAGNEAQNAQKEEPANCRGVITVAATNRHGARSRYTNYGDLVDIAAPGGGSGVGATQELADGILSTLNAGTKEATQDSYAYYQGTSMAAPQVAGVAALLYSLKKDLTPQEVKNILTSSARPFVAKCDLCGAGLLDAKAALTTLQNGDYTNQADPLPSTALKNGVALTNIKYGLYQELYYTIKVPSTASRLTITTQGGKGDMDLYVRQGAQPTLQTFDCRSNKSGNGETCTISSPVAGTYHIMLYGFTDGYGVSLKAIYH